MYVNLDGTLNSAGVNTASGSLMVGRLALLFTGMTVGSGYLYDVAKDGKGLLIASPPNPALQRSAIRVFNCAAAAKK